MRFVTTWHYIMRPLFLTLLFSFCFFANVVYAATVTFDPNPETVSEGQIFTLDIAGLTFQENVDGGGVDFTFDPNIVNVNSVSIDTSVWDFYVDEGTIDNIQGSVTGIVVNAFSNVGPGDFVIAKVEFVAVGAGSTDLIITEYALNPFASGGSRIYPTFTDGKVTVLIPGISADGDLNRDGLVDIVDVLIGHRILNGVVTPTVEQLQAGDVAPLINNVPAPDGEFDIGDVLLIQRKSLGLVDF